MGFEDCVTVEVFADKLKAKCMMVVSSNAGAFVFIKSTHSQFPAPATFN